MVKTSGISFIHTPINQQTNKSTIKQSNNPENISSMFEVIKQTRIMLYSRHSEETFNSNQLKLENQLFYSYHWGLGSTAQKAADGPTFSFRFRGDHVYQHHLISSCGMVENESKNNHSFKMYSFSSNIKNLNVVHSPAPSEGSLLCLSPVRHPKKPPD